MFNLEDVYKSIMTDFEFTQDNLPEHAHAYCRFSRIGFNLVFDIIGYGYKCDLIAYDDMQKWGRWAGFIKITVDFTQPKSIDEFTGFIAKCMERTYGHLPS